MQKIFAIGISFIFIGIISNADTTTSNSNRSCKDIANRFLKLRQIPPIDAPSSAGTAKIHSQERTHENNNQPQLYVNSLKPLTYVQMGSVDSNTWRIEITENLKEIVAKGDSNNRDANNNYSALNSNYSTYTGPITKIDYDFSVLYQNGSQYCVLNKISIPSSNGTLKALTQNDCANYSRDTTPLADHFDDLGYFKQLCSEIIDLFTLPSTNQNPTTVDLSKTNNPPSLGTAKTN